MFWAKDQCVATLYKAACTDNNNHILFIIEKECDHEEETS